MRAELHNNAPLKSGVRPNYRQRYPDKAMYQRAYRQIIGERYKLRILEVLCENEGIRQKDLAKAARIHTMATHYGIKLLEHFGLAAKSAAMWYITERGKIAAALVCGKHVKSL